MLRFEMPAPRWLVNARKNLLQKGGEKMLWKVEKYHLF